MKIVILGAGEVGFQIAKQLIAENKDVVLIEKDAIKAKYASQYLDCMVINDEGNSPDVLKKAGIAKADFFISVADSDEINMISCGLVSSEFNVPYKIARVRNIDYFKTNLIEKALLGIDFIVNPEIEAAKKIINTVEHGAISDIMLFEKGHVQMRNYIVDSSSFLINMPISKVKNVLRQNFLIAGINREKQFIIPRGEAILQENDHLYLVSTEEVLEKIFTQIGKPKKEINKVVIVGGGKIGTYVANYFSGKTKKHAKIFNLFLANFINKSKKNIKIIEKDYEKCKILSEQFPDILVLNADISDESIYEEEQLSDFDLIITTTENQELNILAAIYAKTLGIKRAISLVNKNKYINIATELGIDAIVSPKNSIVNPILKFIRKGNIKSIHSLADGEIEVIELCVEKKSHIAEKKIKDISFPKNSLIIAVTREDETIIPSGDLHILPDDHIIIIAKKDAITKIESMAAVE